MNLTDILDAAGEQKMSGLQESAFQRKVTGQLAHGFMHLQAICDVCQVKRSSGNHSACSKARQAKHQGEAL